jgi:transcriptional regulator with XRE-family HTH domain
MPLTPFGDLLHRLRKNAKLSQRDVATRVGLDVTTLSKLENGHMEPPSAETIQRISTAINANADDARELLRVAREAPREVLNWVREEPTVTDIYRTVQDHVPPSEREAFLSSLVAEARRKLGPPVDRKIPHPLLDRSRGNRPGTPPRGVSSGDTPCQPARSSGAPG